MVSIAFDADVDVFNTVTFNASLKVHDERHGETTSGESGFYGTVGSFRTTYTLNCARV